MDPKGKPTSSIISADQPSFLFCAMLCRTLYKRYVVAGLNFRVLISGTHKINNSLTGILRQQLSLSIQLCFGNWF